VENERQKSIPGDEHLVFKAMLPLLGFQSVFRNIIPAYRAEPTANFIKARTGSRFLLQRLKHAYRRRRRKSSVSIPACLRMCAGVLLLTGLCAGTWLNSHVGERRNLGQISISWITRPRSFRFSSSGGSRYRAMASRMLARASSTVSPSLIHPGSAGT